jgi:ATP-dependent Clp protease ATP-binding subunit ClpA
MSMWEPFSEGARHAVVRAQQVAQMFGSSTIGTEHLAFVLAEGDDELAETLAHAIDREDLRGRLGTVRAAPSEEMTFAAGAKHAIALAFENAHRLDQSFIGSAHLALGVLASGDPLPLRPEVDPAALRAEIDRIARAGEGTLAWKQISGADPHPAAGALLRTLARFGDLAHAGTRVSVTVTRSGEAERTWTFITEEGA